MSYHTTSRIRCDVCRESELAVESNDARGRYSTISVRARRLGWRRRRSPDHLTHRDWEEYDVKHFCPDCLGGDELLPSTTEEFSR